MTMKSSEKKTGVLFVKVYRWCSNPDKNGKMEAGSFLCWAWNSYFKLPRVPETFGCQENTYKKAHSQWEQAWRSQLRLKLRNVGSELSESRGTQDKNKEKTVGLRK